MPTKAITRIEAEHICHTTRQSLTDVLSDFREDYSGELRRFDEGRSKLLVYTTGSYRARERMFSIEYENADDLRKVLHRTEIDGYREHITGALDHALSLIDIKDAVRFGKIFEEQLEKFGLKDLAEVMKEKNKTLQNTKEWMGPLQGGTSS